MSFHSARGIEAARTIIIGLSWLSPFPNHQANSRSMGYIALSRAQHGSRIVAMDGASGAYLTFVEALVAAYQRQLDTSA